MMRNHTLSYFFSSPKPYGYADPQSGLKEKFNKSIIYYK